MDNKMDEGDDDSASAAAAAAGVETMEGLISLPMPLLLLSAVPILGLSLLSHHIGLDLEVPILVGTVRSFVQLIICGSILVPIFSYGIKHAWLVLLYCLFMTILASVEATRRSKYTFKNIVFYVWGAFVCNVGMIALFAFCIIIRPNPLWDPHYVIPIAGMLLGNCINGVALSMNSVLSAMKEDNVEIELYLAFGATSREASSRIFREAVRVGAMPQFNTMAMIGLISIPGMMTGQILGGAPVMDAAKYQILILYLISVCAFGTIMLEMRIAHSVGFDSVSHMLRADRISSRPKKKHQELLKSAVKSCCGFLAGNKRNHKNNEYNNNNNKDSEAQALLPSLNGGTSDYAEAGEQGCLEVFVMRKGQDENSSSSRSETPSYQQKKKSVYFELFRVSKTFKTITKVPSDVIVDSGNDSSRILTNSTNSSKEIITTTTLFQNISVTANVGDIVCVRGPSGVGKSQLLRLIAGLSPMDEEMDEGSMGGGSGEILLMGTRRHEYTHQCIWRRQVRYVSQHKVDITGSPRTFIEKIISFDSWHQRSQQQNSSSEDKIPTFDEILLTTVQIIQKWGLEATFLDEEWKTLSGGEAQRIFLAIAIASRPKVLLMDESTSALDSKSKLRVEETILEIAASYGMAVVWISHDDEQIRRITASPPT